ncbi:MAG: DUF2892 domain-containing protein [Pseudomonadota bacterium]
MWYRKNMGPKERMLRLAAGGAAVAIGFTQFGFTPLGWLLAGSGVAGVLTGMVGFCPACALAGRKPVEGG